MTQLARRHDLTAVMLVHNEFDAEECRRAMQAYCRDVVLVPQPSVGGGLAKRLLQLQSLVSTRSWERRLVAVPEMQRALDRVLRAKGSIWSTWSSRSTVSAICAKPRPTRGSRAWSWIRTTLTTS